MKKYTRVLMAAAVTGATLMASTSAQAFFGPFSWMNSGWGPGWGGWGPGWGGWGPGWGGYPYYGWGGYPYHGWGYPYGGWGYPYGGLGYPWWATAPVVVTQPATKADK